jgi:hypothetical protein
MSRTAWLSLLALPLLFSTSCMGLFTDPLGRRTSLKDSQREYTKYVRWGDIEAASEYIDPELRDAFLGYGSVFEGVRITDFDIGKINWGEGQASATVRVTYHGYSQATLVEKQIHETQEWVRPGRTNTWWVRPGLEGLVGDITGASN